MVKESAMPFEEYQSKVRSSIDVQSLSSQLFPLHFDSHTHGNRMIFPLTNLSPLKDYYLCHTGLHKSIYSRALGVDSVAYCDLFFSQIHPRITALLKQHCFTGVCYIICDNSKQFCILFSPLEHCKMPAIAFAEIIDSCIQEIYEKHLPAKMGAYCNTTVLSDALSGYDGVYRGYQQTQCLKELSFFHMQSGVLTRKRLEELKKHSDYGHAMNTCRRLITSVSHGQREQCANLCRYLFLHILKYSFDMDLVRDILSFLKNAISMRAVVYGITCVDHAALYSSASYITIEECFDAINDSLLHMCEAALRTGVYSDAIIASLYYIRTNLSQPMSLSNIAEYVDLAPNRLSSLFHQETGLTFKQYQLNARIEYALQLITSTDQRISDIAAKCGFIDRRYFTDLFKEHTGMTPQDYRNRKAD